MQCKPVLLSLILAGITLLTAAQTNVLYAAGNEKGATLRFRSPDSEADVFTRGVTLFTDRSYTLAECPKELEGLRFLRHSITNTRATVVEGGSLTVLTPDPSIEGAASNAADLEREGFERVDDIGDFQLFGKNAIDRVRIYRKKVEAGTRLDYGKWCVLVGFAPDSRSAGPGESVTSETLYNGIEIESDPRDRTNMAAYGEEPLPVPYLENPPDVIPVDVGRQLFVDDFLISETSLTRSWHKAEKDPRSPVLKPETPLERGEKSGNSPMAAPFSGGVWYDGSDKLFKAWYCAGWFDGTAYATSPDGIVWTRPGLDVEPGTNRVVPAEGIRDSAAVIMDPDASHGGDRFKMLVWGRPKGGLLHTSADGIHWSSGTFWGATGDRSTIFYNPFRKVWVYSIRSNWSRRSREYAESPDFLKGAGLKNRVRWLRADNLDIPADRHFYAFPDREGPIKKPALYNFDGVAYESLMLGAFTIMTGPENNFCAEEGLPKMTELHLGFSRDGFHWSRPGDRTPFIPGAKKAGTWDRSYLHSNAAICLVMDDELWFYYTGFAGDPARKGKGFDITKNGMYANASMGIARLRRDGFASMDATTKSGALETRTIRFSGKHLFVNVDAPNGKLTAEIVDADGKAIEPFTTDNCIPVTGDKTKTELRWQGATDLAALSGKPVRLRFSLNNGSLYSFWISADASGKSGGYLAGGSPGNATLRDE